MQTIYITLTLAMLFILWLSGRRIAHIKKMSWKRLFVAAWPAILAFTLNEGLRFGRGLDYNIYASHYEKSDRENWDFLFNVIVEFSKELDLGWQSVVMLMSFVLIVSTIIFLRNFPKAAPVALPAFYFFAALYAENLMRWYFAFSFLLIGFSFYLQNFNESYDKSSKRHNKKFKSNLIIFLSCSVIGFFIHFGIAPVFFIYLFFCLFKKPLFHPIITIVIFILTGLSFQTSVMIHLKDFLNLFSFLNSEIAVGYIDNADKWLTGGSDILKQSIAAFPSLQNMIVYFTIVWLGYKVIKASNSRILTIVYNIYIFGFIFLPIGLQIEIFGRYVLTLFSLQFIICGYIFYCCNRHKFVFRNQLIRIYLVFVTLGFGYIQLKYWKALPDYKCMYVWDAHGQDYLDLFSTYYLDMSKTSK